MLIYINRKKLNGLKKIVISLLVGFLLNACAGDGDKDIISVEPIPIYNHAYQENYVADSMEDIVSKARGAYVLVDPFSTGVVEHILTLKANSNQVGGYISVGTGENYRDDFGELEPFLTTKAWAEWSDEFYVSETTTGVLAIMKRRIEKMANWGIEWVEFDNMDWLNEESREKYQLKATQKEARAYISTLCDYVHKKGMKCMAKNIVERFENFDGVLYESSSEEKNWWNEEGTKRFLDSGKLVIINHYNESDCDGAYREYLDHYKRKGISFICEDIVLKGYRHYNEEAK